MQTLLDLYQDHPIESWALITAIATIALGYILVRTLLKPE